MNKCFKRIILDIRDITNDPIEGIYYYPCEENIMKGHALIIGPENTPYQYGNYIFEFNFTNEYPYNPPVVTFLSNDGNNTRYNPNFYRNGKVCLSILNTWKGESWSACQSIRSILITLQFTMNEYPLLNEPGVNMNCHFKCIEKYNDIIRYKNIEHNILLFIIDPSKIPFKNDEIKQHILENFKKNKDKLIEIINNLYNNKEINNKLIILNIYNQKVSLNYDKLIKQITNIDKIL